MKNEQGSASTKKAKRRPPKISTIIRWIIGVLFALMIVLTGLHYSSLFLILAAFFMLPFPFVSSFLKKHKVNTSMVITLSILLLLSGLICSPEEKRSKYVLHNFQSTETNEQIDTEILSTNSATDLSSSDSSSVYEDGTTVFVSASGTKYHIKPNCSNMNSPTPILIEDARLQGYEPCKKCN